MIGLIMGPQGSGKGTQAELIAKDYSFKHASMGDLLREEAKKDSDQGRLVKKTIDAGNLVEAYITNNIIKNILDQNDKTLLDGYPRDMNQAKFLEENNYGIDFVLLVEIGEEESVKRLGQRRICTATNKIYIADQITEEDIAECKAAGGEIITRDDDKPEAIKNRLKVYHQKTQPLIDFYKQKDVKIFRINGEQLIEKVYEDIKKELSNFI